MSRRSRPHQLQWSWSLAIVVNINTNIWHTNTTSTTGWHASCSSKLENLLLRWEAQTTGTLLSKMHVAVCWLITFALSRWWTRLVIDRDTVGMKTIVVPNICRHTTQCARMCRSLLPLGHSGLIVWLTMWWYTLCHQELTRKRAQLSQHCCVFPVQNLGKISACLIGVLRSEWICKYFSGVGAYLEVHNN